MLFSVMTQRSTANDNSESSSQQWLSSEVKYVNEEWNHRRGHKTREKLRFTDVAFKVLNAIQSCILCLQNAKDTQIVYVKAREEEEGGRAEGERNCKLWTLKSKNQNTLSPKAIIIYRPSTYYVQWTAPFKYIFVLNLLLLFVKWIKWKKGWMPGLGVYPFLPCFAN